MFRAMKRKIDVVTRQSEVVWQMLVWFSFGNSVVGNGTSRQFFVLSCSAHGRIALCLQYWHLQSGFNAPWMKSAQRSAPM